MIRYFFGDVTALASKSKPFAQQKEVKLSDLMQKIEEYATQNNRMSAMINGTLQGIDKRLQRIEKCNLPEAENPYDLIAGLIPINDPADIQTVSDVISSNLDATLQLKKLLSKVGGKSPKVHVQRGLGHIFTNNCAAKVTWKGRKNSLVIANLSIIKIFKETMCTSRDGMSEHKFEEICSEWFRFSKQRLGRAERKNTDVGQLSVVERSSDGALQPSTSDAVSGRSFDESQQSIRFCKFPFGEISVRSLGGVEDWASSASQASGDGRGGSRC